MDNNYNKIAHDLQEVMSNLNAENYGKGISKEHKVFKNGCKLVGDLIRLLEKKNSLFYKIKTKIPGFSISIKSDNLTSFIDSESLLLKEIGLDKNAIDEGLKRITKEPIDNIEPDYDETIEALRKFQHVLCMAYLLSKRGDISIDNNDFFKIISNGLFDVILIIVDVPLLKVPGTYFASIGSIYAGTRSLFNNIKDAHWKFEVISTEKTLKIIKKKSQNIIKLRKFKKEE